MRACQNPSPVIDGRRANCNLASLGANKNRPPTFQHGPFPYIVLPFFLMLYHFFHKVRYQVILLSSLCIFLQKQV